MTARRLRVRRDTYVDSVQLMVASREMAESAGVEWATAVMGTAANLETLAGDGFATVDLEPVRANDLVLAARAASSEEAETALEAGESTLRGARRGEPPAEGRPLRSVEEAVAALHGANVAIVSVPGPYAALEAHRALSQGLHVLLFSDNVPIEDEAELKERGRRLGLLVMGPGAGTAMLGGAGLAFANAVRRGPVGVVAAAGTGAQEAMSLLDRWGMGPSHVIGVGGRDLSSRIRGAMTRLAVRALERDPGTEALLLVSKPPAADVAAEVLAGLGAKPTVAALIGLEGDLDVPAGVRLARTIHAAVADTLELLGSEPPPLSEGLSREVSATAGRLGTGRHAVRGLFSGGTLCYESMVLLSSRLGPVHSNAPLRAEWGLPAPAGAHVCLDLGEEEFTRGRPHPMIDAEARVERIRQEAGDPSTAVLLVDVVLGYGAHPDPASVLAPVCAEVTSRDDGPAVVAYVLGTKRDPQGFERQRVQLREAGCLIAPTGARAALMAAGLAGRRPGIAEEAL